MVSLCDTHNLRAVLANRYQVFQASQSLELKEFPSERKLRQAQGLIASSRDQSHVVRTETKAGD